MGLLTWLKSLSGQALPVEPGPNGTRSRGTEEGQRRLSKTAANEEYQRKMRLRSGEAGVCDICGVGSSEGWHTMTHEQLKANLLFIDYALALRAFEQGRSPPEIGSVCEADRVRWLAEMESTRGDAGWRLCPGCHTQFAHTCGRRGF